jgi:uncharacterized membrane protein YfcA
MLLDGGASSFAFDLATTPLQGGVDLGVLSLMTTTSLFGATFGFGDAIIAIPLLALLFNVEVAQAAPLQTIVSSCLGVLILLVDAQGEASGRSGAKIGRYGESLVLFAAAAVGVPFGVQVLVSVDPGLIRAVVGCVLVLYGAWALATGGELAEATESSDATPIPRGGDSSAGDAADDAAAAASGADWALPPTALPFGLVAGSLCGAVGEPGPVAILYGQLQKWPPLVLRGMLARFFLPVQCVTLREFYVQGLLTDGILEQSLASLPSVVVAVAIGTKLNRAFDPARFATAVDGLVVGLGCICLYSAFAGV